ncbi:MAG: OmpH family outer membrane protein [Planctomycetes bacterium]|nr:OmpH family outer membrane protein [Planctomycetota bacterium]
MKNLTLALAAALFLTSVLGTAQAQNTKPAAPTAVKIGLVDMARVFKEYDKFKDLREVLKGKMESRMAEAKDIADKAKAIQGVMKQLKPGSTQFIQNEAQLAELTTRFQTKQKLAQAEYVREEAKIFEQVYVESRDVIKLYSEHFKYTLVLRFNSQSLDPEDKNPQGIANSLNKLVVYHRPQDDITDAVVEYLNRRYKPTPKPAPRVGGNTTPTRTK